MATDRYAVIGHGISYSRSPQIHAWFAQQCGQPIEYGLIDAAPADFAASARAFLAGGGRGLNVTVPFKQEALQLADVLGERAREAGAVNTLAVQPDGRVLGDNTDGTGLVRDIAGNQRCRLAGARVLLLGAGGAARGVAAPLLRAGLARLAIANRTAERAAELARRFAPLGPVVALTDEAVAGGAQAGGAGAYDIILNATAASRGGELPAIPAGAVGPHTLCYDMGYAQGDSVFQQWARAAGAGRVADGLGMLVEQAAESFLLWRGVRPDTAPVLARLRATT
jgi:shikimate dehydrogenase